MRTQKDVCDLITKSLKTLEEARQAMVSLNSSFTTEEVHLVAIAQYHVGKARDALRPQNVKKGR